MTLKYLKLHIKSMLSHPSILGWGVGGTIIWAALGAFIFSAEFLKTLEGSSIGYYVSALYYTAGWFGCLSLYSFSTLATGLMFNIFYSTASVVYASKFTKLTPVKYYIYNVLSSLLIFLVLSLFTLASVYGFYSYSFKVNLYPRNIMLILVFSLIAGLFLYLLSMLLTLLPIVLGHPKAVTTIAYAPMIFAMVFSYAQLYLYFTGIEEIICLSPFNNIISLLAYGYTGMNIPITFTSPEEGFINIYTCLTSLICWLVALSVINIYIIKKMKAVSPYEFF